MPTRFLEALTQDRFSYSRELAVQGRHKGAEENFCTLWTAQAQEEESGAELSMLSVIFPHSNQSD